MAKELDILDDFLQCLEIGSSSNTSEHNKLTSIATRLRTDVPGAVEEFNNAEFDSGKPSLRVARAMIESVLIAHQVGSVKLNG